MPTYEYQCEKCEYLFEVFQSIHEEPLKSCPECGNGVKRLIGGGMGIIFKGSGFYSTDNRSGTAPKENKPEKKPEKAGGGNGDKKPAASETSSSTSKDS